MSSQKRGQMSGDWRIEVVRDAIGRDKAYALRRLVFVDEQKVPADLEIDAHEDSSLHFLATDSSGEPVGVGRLRPKGGFAKFERIATRSDLRGRGVGRALMGFMQREAAERFPSLLPYMHAQLSAAPFYEAIGWQRVGEEFDEANIRHVAMAHLPQEPHRLSDQLLVEGDALPPGVHAWVLRYVEAQRRNWADQ